MYWTDTVIGDRPGHHCLRHSADFLIGEVCHECITDPGDAPSGVVDDPAYQKALLARINEYQSRARTCWRKVLQLDEEGNKREENTAVKWSAEAVKWARLAEERQEVLDRRQHNLDLIRHEEAMSGQRGARD